MHAITEPEGKNTNSLVRHIRGRKVFYEENIKTIYRVYNSRKAQL